MLLTSANAMAVGEVLSAEVSFEFIGAGNADMSIYMGRRRQVRSVARRTIPTLKGRWCGGSAFFADFPQVIITGARLRLAHRQSNLQLVQGHNFPDGTGTAMWMTAGSSTTDLRRN